MQNRYMPVSLNLKEIS